jgi:hypothetical protein
MPGAINKEENMMINTKDINKDDGRSGKPMMGLGIRTGISHMQTAVLKKHIPHASSSSIFLFPP